MSRPRVAPIACRIDSSRSRIALRTCTIPETFRHTTSSGIALIARQTAMMTATSEASMLPRG